MWRKSLRSPKPRTNRCIISELRTPNLSASGVLFSGDTLQKQLKILCFTACCAECLTTYREYDNNLAGFGAHLWTPAVQRPAPADRAGFPQRRMEWISRKIISKTTTSCQGWKKMTSWAAL